MLEGDVRASQADTSMAENMLKWKSKRELKEWLEDLFEMDGKIEN